MYSALVWRQDGDHPAVRPYRRPDVPDDQICKLCGNVMLSHGWIDQSGPGCGGGRFKNTLSNPHHAFFMPEDNRVCPGGFVIDGGAGIYSCVSPKDFWAVFERA